MLMPCTVHRVVLALTSATVLLGGQPVAAQPTAPELEVQRLLAEATALAGGPRAQEAIPLLAGSTGAQEALLESACGR
jgi:hypothetical protein